MTIPWKTLKCSDLNAPSGRCLQELALQGKSIEAIDT
jgi:hypothetical protein